MFVKDKPTERVLTYRGNKYQQFTYKRGDYPANMWLTYRTVRYRPASFKYQKALMQPADDKDRSTLIT